MGYEWSQLARSSIGFERLFSMLEESHRTTQEAYPPYNLEKIGDNRFQVCLALAGFEPDDLTVAVEPNVLIIEGTSHEDEAHYFHRGILTRPFRRRFTLEDHIEVRRADFSRGLLVVELEYEAPEGARPRRIPLECRERENVTRIGLRVA
jgi:molecular chaperone IbpA